MSWNLPKLPGYTFRDPTKTNYHLGRKFEFYNGYPITRFDSLGIGGSPIDTENIAHIDVKNEFNYNPQIFYGATSRTNLPSIPPKYVLFDKKHLIFKAFMKDNLGNVDANRIVTIIYYLEDDTMTILEPHVKNSGLWQGKMVKRGKIMNEKYNQPWHWKNLNIGIDIMANGMVFHTFACDDFTKEFLRSQGIELDNEENYLPNQKEQCCSNYKYTSQLQMPDESSEKLERFLIYDNKTLKFDAIWDNDSEDYRDVRKYKLLYHLYDNTVSIKEIYTENCGRDSFPMLLRRTKIPKSLKRYRVPTSIGIEPSTVVCDNYKDEEEYYSAKDLLVGNTINVLGRNFLLYDCDINTRNYYADCLNITQSERIQIPDYDLEMTQTFPKSELYDDPSKSCITFRPTSPHKNVIQYNLNTNKNLRYLCQMESVHPENTDRHFILLYNLADGTVRIDELTKKNSGISGGRFFGPSKLSTPDGKYETYYTPDMFYIGSHVIVNQYKFCIVGADLFVYNYMKENPDKFPSHVIDNMYNYHYKCGNIQEERLGTSPVQHEGLITEDTQMPQTPPQPNKWTPPPLAPELHGMKCAQTLPPTDEEQPKEKDRDVRPIACLTGLSQMSPTERENQQCFCYEGNYPENGIVNEEKYVNDVNINDPIEDNTHAKKVTFAE